MFRKMTALLLALLMLTACVTSLAEGNDPFAKYDEPVTITVAKNLGAGTLDFPEGDSIESNVWTRLYKDALNVDVKFVWTTNEQQYAQKVNISIMSNDVPDVMAVNAQQLAMMYENGQLMDMTDILENNISEQVRENLYADGGLALSAASFDGRLYAIPAVGSGLLSAYVLWVRTDWLDNLGLSIPTTMDELMTVAEAFTRNDPDGNGKDDTYGLAVYKDLFEGGFACLEGFFNCYGAYPNIWLNQDGTLAHGSVQPEMKDALAALQRMYAEGLLDPEFGVKDANKVCEDVAAGKFGLMFGNFWNAAWINDAKVANPTMEWVPVALPSMNGTTPKAQIPFGTTNYYAISANCKNPEAIVRLLNLQMEKNYGATAEPTVYNITPEGYGPYMYTVVAIEPPMKNFDAAVKVTAALETGDTSLLNDEEKGYYDMCVLCQNGDYGNNNWHQMKMFGPAGSLTVIKDYNDNGNIMVDAFYGAATQTMSEKLSTLKKQQLIDFTAIIMGESIDKYDAFVSTWNKLGGEKMTAEVNEWFESLH